MAAKKDYYFSEGNIARQAARLATLHQMTGDELLFLAHGVYEHCLTNGVPETKARAYTNALHEKAITLLLGLKSGAVIQEQIDAAVDMDAPKH